MLCKCSLIEEGEIVFFMFSALCISGIFRFAYWRRKGGNI